MYMYPHHYYISAKVVSITNDTDSLYYLQAYGYFEDVPRSIPLALDLPIPSRAIVPVESDVQYLTRVALILINTDHYALSELVVPTGTELTITRILSEGRPLYVRQ